MYFNIETCFIAVEKLLERNQTVGCSENIYCILLKNKAIDSSLAFFRLLLEPLSDYFGVRIRRAYRVILI